MSEIDEAKAWKHLDHNEMECAKMDKFVEVLQESLRASEAEIAKLKMRLEKAGQGLVIDECLVKTQINPEMDRLRAEALRDHQQKALKWEALEQRICISTP